MVHTLLANIIAKDGKRDAIVQEIQKLADWCKTNEPNTLTYQIQLSIDNPNKLTVMERYKSRSDLDDVHLKSEKFNEFRGLIKDFVADVKHNNYDEADGVGWVSR